MFSITENIFPNGWYFLCNSKWVNLIKKENACIALAMWLP